jgi:hypothetical protein
LENGKTGDHAGDHTTGYVADVADHMIWVNQAVMRL